MIISQTVLGIILELWRVTYHNIHWTRVVFKIELPFILFFIYYPFFCFPCSFFRFCFCFFILLVNYWWEWRREKIRRKLKFICAWLAEALGMFRFFTIFCVGSFGRDSHACVSAWRGFLSCSVSQARYSWVQQLSPSSWVNPYITMTRFLIRLY